MHRGRPDQTVHSESGNLDSARGLRLDSADAAVSYHPLRPQQICGEGRSDFQPIVFVLSTESLGTSEPSLLEWD